MLSFSGVAPFGGAQPQCSDELRIDLSDQQLRHDSIDSMGRRPPQVGLPSPWLSPSKEGISQGARIEDLEAAPYRNAPQRHDG
jgi:hypothetical protein